MAGARRVDRTSAGAATGGRTSGGLEPPTWVDGYRRTPCDRACVEETAEHPTATTPGEHEDEIAREVFTIRECVLADAATSVLAFVIAQATGVALPAERAARWHRTAVTVAAVRAFRAIRAGMALTSRGYELEADAMTRIMVELVVGTDEVLADPTGEEAERWLAQAMGKKIAARVDAAVAQPDGVYGPLSRAAHGDARGVLSLLDATADAPSIDWGPKSTARAASILRSYAVGARDFVVLVEEVTGADSTTDARQLDRLLTANIEGFAPDEDWTA